MAESADSAAAASGTPRTLLLSKAGMKRKAVEELVAVLDAEEFDTEDDLMELLKTEETYDDFKEAHKAEFKMAVWAKLETIRTSALRQATTQATTSSAPSATAPTPAPSAPPPAATPAPAPVSAAANAPPASAVPVSATPPAFPIPAAPASAMPEFPTELSCGELERPTSLLVAGLSVCANASAVFATPDWGSCSDHFIQFSRSAISSRHEPLSESDERSVTVLRGESSDPTPLAVARTLLGDAPWYGALLRI